MSRFDQLTEMMTRAELEFGLREVTGSEQTIQAILAIGGPLRHEQRVRRVRDIAHAACEEHFESGQDNPRPIDFLIWQGVLCLAELNGVGGAMGAGGRTHLGPPQTRRQSLFSCCGTGRRHAGDGEAWNAAFTAVFQESRIDERNIVPVPGGLGVRCEEEIVPVPVELDFLEAYIRYSIYCLLKEGASPVDPVFKSWVGAMGDIYRPIELFQKTYLGNVGPYSVHYGDGAIWLYPSSAEGRAEDAPAYTMFVDEPEDGPAAEIGPGAPDITELNSVISVVGLEIIPQDGGITLRRIR